MVETNVMLVEGNDDKHVLYALLKHHRIPKAFEVINREGIDNLLATLPVELRRSDLERVGIIIDANTSLGARWAALRGILTRVGRVDIPVKPDPSGTIVTLSRPDRVIDVGVWLMPDNQLPGMLEDFIEFLVPTGDALWPRAADCVEQLPVDERRFGPDHQRKAKVHTWLAWQEDPGTPLGQAITKRYLDANLPQAHVLVDWIRRLYSLSK